MVKPLTLITEQRGRDGIRGFLTLSRTPSWSTALLQGRLGLWVILLLALTTRLYKVTAPLTDATHERQTMTAEIARNFYRDGLDLLHPRIDSTAPGPGYLMLEFPIQPGLMAIAYHFVGIHDIVGRLITIAFSMGSIVFMFILARLLLPAGTALFVTATYALTPMSIYFGRSVHPEVLGLFFSLGALYFILRWREDLTSRFYWLSALFTAMAFLIKPPPGLVMLLPISAVWWVRCRTMLIRRADFYLYFVVALLPITLWALWSRRIGATDPGYNPYQLSALARWGIPSAWFTSEFYLWVSRSLITVMLTPIIALLAVVGLFKARHHPLAVVIYAWAVAMIVFVFLTPGAQATHWNYQIPLIPIGALLAGIGFSGLPSNEYAVEIWKAMEKRSRTAIALALLIGAGYVAIYVAVILNSYNEQKRVPHVFEVARIVQAQVPSTGFVMLISPGMHGSTQSYYMDRKTRILPIDEQFTDEEAVTEIETWISRGAVALVAEDTPYGDGTAVVRNHPQLKAYLDAHSNPVTSAAGYMIYSLR